MSFLLAFSTVFPMFFYMAAGFGLRRLNKLSEGTVAQMNKIIYSFCFPFVLFHNVYGVDIASAMNGPFLAVIAVMIVLVTALLAAWSAAATAVVLLLRPEAFPSWQTVGALEILIAAAAGVVLAV